MFDYSNMGKPNPHSLVNYNPNLICRPTAYALAHETHAFSNNVNEDFKYPDDTDGCCDWWLRSPGKYQYRAAMVTFYGSMDYRNVSFFTPLGVRPAILID